MVKDSNMIASLALVAALVMCTARTVSADCKITDNDEKFEIVCSGGADAQKKSGKRVTQHKVAVEKGSLHTHSVVKMSAEELKFMETRNRQDGYRKSRKTPHTSAVPQPAESPRS